MREILFRGKDDYGKWLFGDLINITGEIKQICNHTQLEHAHSVNPETVGQYTGLNDKNGTKIFEGDIVRYKNNSPCKIEYIDCQFALMWERLYRNFEDVYDHEIEVIGNIHDNPEMLEGDKDNG